MALRLWQQEVTCVLYNRLTTVFPSHRELQSQLVTCVLIDIPIPLDATFSLCFFYKMPSSLHQTIHRAPLGPHAVPLPLQPPPFGLH